MSKSNRRNYRNKIDSDEESSSSKLSSQNNAKTDTVNSVTLSFGDELDDVETFKEKKVVHTKKIAVKPKETKRKVVKPTTSQNVEELDICVQNNVIINVKSLSPPKPINICSSFYDDNATISIIQKGDIPDAMAIDRAKKQRELAKQKLETEKSSSEEEDEKSFSINRRSVFMSQHDINPDETKRMAMSIDVNTTDRERKLMKDHFLEQGSDHDSDQENEWETRQLQKAMNISVNQPKDTKKIDWQRHAKETNDDDVIIKSAILDDLHSISLEDISVSTLADLLNHRKVEILATRERNEADIYEKETSIISNDDKVNIASIEIPMLEMKFNCFNNFKRFLNILVQCFDEKMEKIVYLEKKFIKIHKERSEKLLKRSRQDIQDQFDEIILKIKTSAIQSTIEMTNRFSRISEKESRRLRRIRARETLSITNHYDGLSSDDDEPKSMLTTRQNDIDQIKNDSSQLFNGTDPEYCTIEKILEKFAAVRSQFSAEYKDAYINGFLPHVLSPLVRMELVAWNPLIVPHFHKWNWFKTLIQFTKESVGTDPVKVNSIEFADLKIIPNIMEKYVVPKLIEWASIWNPKSKTETQNLVKFIHKLTSQIPTFNDKNVHVRNLLKSIACRIHECVAEDISIPIYIEQYKENPNGTAFIFFQQQMWNVIKTFANIMSLHEILDCGLLCKLALEGVLNNYVITGLMILSEMGFVTDVIAKMNMIKHSFPEHWFVTKQDGQTDNGVDVSEQLTMVIGFVKNFGYNHRKDKAAVSFALSTLDYFNVGRGDLVARIND